MITRAPVRTQTLEVYVSLADIREGDQHMVNSCAIALAARRASGADIAQMVHSGLTLYWRDGDGSIARVEKFQSSNAAVDWMYAFDDSRDSVAPERFVFWDEASEA